MARQVNSKKDMDHFNTGAVRENKTGKGRPDLLPACALLRISKHMEQSLQEYPERNWEKGLPMSSMIGAAMRHLLKYMAGQTDEDHLCAATTNLLMAMWTEERFPMGLPGEKRAFPVFGGPDTRPSAPGPEKAQEEPRKKLPGGRHGR